MQIIRHPLIELNTMRKQHFDQQLVETYTNTCGFQHKASIMEYHSFSQVMIPGCGNVLTIFQGFCCSPNGPHQDSGAALLPRHQIRKMASILAIAMVELQPSGGQRAAVSCRQLRHSGLGSLGAAAAGEVAGALRQQLPTHDARLHYKPAQCIYGTKQYSTLTVHLQYKSVEYTNSTKLKTVHT